MADGSLEEKQPHPLVVEDLLGDDRAAEDRGQGQADQGHDRQDRIPHDMPRQHAALRHALGARGAQEILREHVDRRSAHVAAEPGHAGQGQRQHRQDQARRVRQHAADGRRLGCQRRQPVKLDAAERDQHQREEEVRHRVQRERDAVEQVIARAVPLHRLVDAHRDGDGQGEDGGDPQQQRVFRHPLNDQRRHRLLELIRRSEVAVAHLHDIVEELDVERLVKAVRLIEDGDLLGGGLEPQDRPGRAARDHVDHDERHDHDADHHHDGLGSAPGEVGRHFVKYQSSGLRPPLNGFSGA